MKILSTRTPEAKNEHICSICGKSIIKGEKYLDVTMIVNGKIMHRKQHYGCHEQPTSANIVPLSTQARLKGIEVPMPEEKMFKNAIKAETAKMIDTFSFQESMEICFIPLVLTELAFRSAFDCISKATKEKVKETKELSKAVKFIRSQYIEQISKDIDLQHQKHFMSETERFIREHSRDFTIMWFTCNQSIKKQTPNVRKVCIYAIQRRVL